MTFQDLILKLTGFWAEQGAVVVQPYDMEMGAGTMHPETFFRVLGPTPWKVVYVQPSRRPADGRYGENPNRLYKHHQLQLILKPAPQNIRDLYQESLAACGVDAAQHDLRFEDDNWAAPTLGAWGVGWQVVLDGLEISQFTYFQQAGGVELAPISVEITYGLERLAMYLQDVDDVYQLRWNDKVKYGEVRFADERQSSIYAFEEAAIEELKNGFEEAVNEGRRLVDKGLVIPGYEHCPPRFAHFQPAGFPWGGFGERSSEQDSCGARIGDGCGQRVSEGRTGMSAQEFLLEIGCEELPAEWLDPLSNEFEALLTDGLRKAEIEDAPVRCFGTPRRLVAHSMSVKTGQPDRIKQKIGPPLRVGRTEHGEWTRAALGFARRLGLEGDEAEDALTVLETDRGSYVGVESKIPGRTAVELLPEVIEGALRRLAFPKPMNWDASIGGDHFPFGRPIRWIVALYGGGGCPVSH